MGAAAHKPLGFTKVLFAAARKKKEFGLHLSDSVSGTS
jgi:hypothetical protein